MWMELVWFFLFVLSTIISCVYRTLAVTQAREIDRLIKENFRLKIEASHHDPKKSAKPYL